MIQTTLYTYLTHIYGNGKKTEQKMLLRTQNIVIKQLLDINTITPTDILYNNIDLFLKKLDEIIIP